MMASDGGSLDVFPGVTIGGSFLGGGNGASSCAARLMQAMPPTAIIRATRPIDILKVTGFQVSIRIVLLLTGFESLLRSACPMGIFVLLPTVPGTPNSLAWQSSSRGNVANLRV